MRFFIEISYNGRAYHGWQIQPEAISVQEVVEKALSTLLQDQIQVVGAGRTDAGVHAKQMFAHFDFEKSLDPNLVFRLNSYLPSDIAIHDIFEVHNDAHARFDAISRTYQYRVSTRKNVFSSEHAFMQYSPIDVSLMNTASAILLQYKDFQCFSKSNTNVKTYNCSIKEAKWQEHDNELIFVVTADRFLRNMVRAIVGTLINIGLGKVEVEQLHEIIKSKSRSEAGFSVPAHGLYLTDVNYPETIKIQV